MARWIAASFWSTASVELGARIGLDGCIVIGHGVAVAGVNDGVAHALQLHSLPAVGPVANALHGAFSGLIHLLAEVEQRRLLLGALSVGARRARLLGQQRCGSSRTNKRDADQHAPKCGCAPVHGSSTHRCIAVRRAVWWVMSSGLRAGTGSGAKVAGMDLVVVAGSR